MSKLTRKKITVKRKGKTFQRSVMVKSDNSASSFNKHFGKSVYGKAALAGVAAGASIYGGARLGSRVSAHKAGKVAGSLIGGFAAHKASYAAADHVLREHGWSHGADDAYNRLRGRALSKVNSTRSAAWVAGQAVGFVGAWGAHTIARRIRR